MIGDLVIAFLAAVLGIAAAAWGYFKDIRKVE
jgi:hypothetical protein